MTLKELSQLFYLSREIENDKRRLDELESIASSPSSSHITGMPSAPYDGSSKTERIVAEMLDLRAVIAAKQIQCIHERARLERYIADIPDSLTRLIFLCRFVDCLSWSEVADYIGGGNTEDAVKKRCYRYLHDEVESVIA